MKRKNKTITTTQIKPLSKKKLMRSVTIKDQSLTQIDQLDVSSIAGQFVEEFINIACQHIHYQEMIHMNISKFNQGFTIIQGGFYGLSPSEPAMPQFTPCEDQPQPTRQAYNCKMVHENKQNQSILKTNESRMRISKTCSIKSKSKSQEQKYINLHHIKKSQLKQKRSAALLPLINFNRHSEDNSSDIQELMRRKKELQLHTCKTQRLSTNLSKISREHRKQKQKQKYFYYQNDQGNANKVKINSKQKQQYQQGITTAKYEPGSTLYDGIKKKPITELIATKRRRKRKNQKTTSGDTCLLVQKKTELQLQHSQDIFQKLLQKGVNLHPKEEHSNDERYSQKLPTFR